MSFQEATTDLLGERYAHLQECTYKNQLNSLFFTSNVSHSNQQGGGFVANNSNYRFPNLCDPIISYNTPYLLNTSYSTTVDLQRNRYAHLRECEYYKSDYSGLTTFTRNNDYSLPVSAYNRQPQGDI